LTQIDVFSGRPGGPPPDADDHKIHDVKERCERV